MSFILVLFLKLVTALSVHRISYSLMQYEVDSKCRNDTETVAVVAQYYSLLEPLITDGILLHELVNH